MEVVDGRIDPAVVEFDTVEQKLEAEMQRDPEFEALEVMEGMTQIQVMVVEAVWMGFVRAVEEEASRVAEVREGESLKLKKQLRSQESVISDMIKVLREKDEELARVQERRRHLELRGQIIEKKDAPSYCMEGEDSSSSELMQERNDLLNCRIQELTSVHSLLIEEVGNYKAEVEAQQRHVGEQESSLRETERRCHSIVVVANYLHEKVALLSSKLLEYEDAALVEMEGQNWKHKVELESAELVKDVPTNHVETVTSKSRILQRSSSERADLQTWSSNGILETRLEETEAARSIVETSMHEERQKLAGKNNELETALSRIAELERKLVEKENLVRNLEKEVAEARKREESGSVEVKGLTEHDGAENVGESMVEKVCMVDTEKMLCSFYMETASPDIQSITAEIMSVSEDEGQSPGSECKPDRAHEDIPDSRETIASGTGKGTRQKSIQRTVQKFPEAQAGSTDRTPEAQELKDGVSEEHTQIENLRKEFEEKLTKKEEEVIQLQEALEEISWRSEVEDLVVLGFGEGICQQMMELRHHLGKVGLEARQEAERKSRCVAVLEKEVCQQKQKVVLLEAEFSTAIRQMNVGLEGQVRSLMTSMQRFEGEIAGELNQFDSRLQQVHCSLRQVKMGFEARIQVKKERVALEQVGREEIDWRRHVENLLILGCGKNLRQHMSETRQQLEKGSDARQEAEILSRRAAVLENEISQLRNEIALREDELSSANEQMKVGFEEQSQNLTKLMQRLDGDISRKVEQLESRLQRAHDAFEWMKAGHEEQIQIKNEEIIRFQEAEEDSNWRSQVENILILGYAEGLCQQLSDFRQQLERKSLEAFCEAERNGELEDEVSELRSEISHLESELASVNGKVKVEVEGEVQSLMTLMQRFEGDLVGVVDQLDSKWQRAHGTLERVKSSFEWQLQAKEDEEVTKLQEAVEERRWRSEVENFLILAYAECLCQQTTDMSNKNSLDARNESEHENRRLQEALQETEWQNQIEKFLILGYGESVCQQMTGIRQQLEKERFDARNEAGEESRRVAVLENEISHLRNEIVLVEDELSSVSRQMKVGFTEELQSLMRTMQRFEWVIAGKVGHCDSRLEKAHCSLGQMRAGFQGRIQSAMASAQLLEQDLAGKEEQFETRMQEARYSLKLATQNCRQMKVKEAQYFKDLQKAEAEVDFLGDDVEALMELLEKVYIVLTHYHPVIQLYPGLAELSNLVKAGVLERVSGSDAVSVQPI